MLEQTKEDIKKITGKDFFRHLTKLHYDLFRIYKIEIISIRVKMIYVNIYLVASPEKVGWLGAALKISKNYLG
jgi:hypothetical protein